jgi:hypothetical protein
MTEKIAGIVVVFIVMPFMLYRLGLPIAMTIMKCPGIKTWLRLEQ